MDGLLQKSTNAFPRFSIFWAEDRRNQNCNLCVKLLRSPTLKWLKTESHAQVAGEFDKMQRHHEQTPTMVFIQDQNLHKHTKKGGKKNY